MHINGLVSHAALIVQKSNLDEHCVEARGCLIILNSYSSIASPSTRKKESNFCSARRKTKITRLLHIGINNQCNKPFSITD